MIEEAGHDESGDRYDDYDPGVAVHFVGCAIKALSRRA
jgi:hypothetical protein